MKKFLIIVALLIALYFACDIAVYQFGMYIDFAPGSPISVVSASDEETIFILEDGSRIPYEVRGVTVGTGIPGHNATDFAADRETYLRWFGQIAEMGANTIRATMLYDSDFYDALYEHNNANPGGALRLIQGVYVEDYLLGSSRDITDTEILGRFKEHAQAAVDAVHGRLKTYSGRNIGSGTYLKDVSPWVLAFMVGNEWDSHTIAYTNDKHGDSAAYSGTYLSAGENANAFESFLAEVGDHLIAYESRKYKRQRLFTFASAAITDPFEYDKRVSEYYQKIARLDIGNLVPTDAYGAGLFAAYNLIPYHNDLFGMEKHLLIQDLDDAGDDPPKALTPLERDHSMLRRRWEVIESREPLFDLDEVLRKNAAGQSDYRQYLEMLVRHHNCPVVVTEFGYSSSRGIASTPWDSASYSGAVNETEQARLVTEGLEEIRDAGCAGVCLAGWQDEWNKKSWNTLEKVDLLRNIYWSDAQTASQGLGVMAMDPGETEVLCHVDGNDGEWGGVPVSAENRGVKLYCQYDERFLYLLVRTEDTLDEPIYIPMDITPKSGSAEPRNLNAAFNRDADFAAVLDISGESRLTVQLRYETLRALDGFELYGRNGYADAPAAGHPDFETVAAPLRNRYYIDDIPHEAELTDTGILRAGVSDPASPDYDSLADFCAGDGFVELRLPWQMLNFSDPSRMAIHDDYYEHYGAEPLYIRGIRAGAGFGGDAPIAMETIELEAWDDKVSYHERLKPCYYAVSDYWRKGGAGR